MSPLWSVLSKPHRTKDRNICPMLPLRPPLVSHKTFEEEIMWHRAVGFPNLKHTGKIIAPFPCVARIPPPTSYSKNAIIFAYLRTVKPFEIKICTKKTY